MRNRLFIVSLIILAASIAGIVLSTFLIFEYFGVTPSVADAVCTRGQGGVNACTVASASRFAGIRGLPLIGDVPVAVMGFVFYGFVAALVILHGLRRNTESLSKTIVIITALTGAAFLGDIVLYIISVYVIKFVCPLCVMTYAATFIMFVSSILILKNPIHSTRGSFFMSMMQHIRKHGLSMALIVIVLGAGGMGIGAGAKLIARGTKAVSLEDRIKEAIRQYETTGTVDIDKTVIPFLGKKSAPAHFTVFFDFTCDHCQDEILLLDRLMKSHLDAVSITFKFLPLNGDCGSLDNGRNNPSAAACIAAAASYCAYKQGHFMDYAKSLFELYHVKGASFTSKSVRELAKSKKLDMAVFNTCFSSTATREFIVRQCRESEKLGIPATPTLYLNGKLLTDGLRKPEILEKLIQYCVKRDKSK